MNKLIATLSILFFCNIGFSQDLNSVVNADKIHWFGVDFTNAKMIGTPGFTNPDVICERYIQKKWNTYVFFENEKYDMSKFLKGKPVEPHLKFILDRNSVVTTDGLIINDDHQISKTDIQNTINQYNINKNGVGLVFVVESFNKLNESANIWVTFFDMSTKNILYTNEYIVEPGGFGVLNYWLGSIYQTCKELKKDYRKWERDYS